jgi:integrase
MNELVARGTVEFTTEILSGSVSPSTMRMYERDFRAYLVYAGNPSEAIASSTFARWRTHLASTTSLSPNTINRMLSAVKRLMDEAETQGYVAKGTAEDFKRVHGVRVEALKHRQKVTSRVRISPQEMRMLTSLPDVQTLSGIRDCALLHTLASSGLRVDELATLKKSQILPRTVRIMGKNDTEYRDAHLSREAYEAIELWMITRPVDSEFVFTSFAGKGDRLTAKHMQAVSIWRTVKFYAREAGLDNVKPHDFRRFVGTQLAKVNPRQAQKALGHKKIGTTMDNYVLDELEHGLTDSLY